MPFHNAASQTFKKHKPRTPAHDGAGPTTTVCTQRQVMEHTYPASQLPTPILSAELTVHINSTSSCPPAHASTIPHAALLRTGLQRPAHSTLSVPTPGPSPCLCSAARGSIPEMRTPCCCSCLRSNQITCAPQKKSRPGRQLVPWRILLLSDCKLCCYAGAVLWCVYQSPASPPMSLLHPSNTSRPSTARCSSVQMTRSS
jgi:hypothetical protein